MRMDMRIYLRVRQHDTKGFLSHRILIVIMSSLSHVGIAAPPSKYDAVVAFYAHALAPLDYIALLTFPGVVGMGSAQTKVPDFWISSKDDAAAQQQSHIAFNAKGESYSAVSSHLDHLLRPCAVLLVAYACTRGRMEKDLRLSCLIHVSHLDLQPAVKYAGDPPVFFFFLLSVAAVIHAPLKDGKHSVPPCPCSSFLLLSSKGKSKPPTQARLYFSHWKGDYCLSYQ